MCAKVIYVVVISYWYKYTVFGFIIWREGYFCQYDKHINFWLTNIKCE